MITKKSVLVATCDAPRCGVQRMGDATGSEPLGYRSRARHVHENGATAVIDWYACSDECIQPAVQDTLRASENGNS